MEDAYPILRAAEDVLHRLHEHQLDAVVIGAVALAAHRYVRQTEDLDLGVNANVPKLRQLTNSLQAAGYKAELREPDAEDPLGGVIDVEGPFGLIQIISYADKFPAVIDDALRQAQLTARAGSPLKLVPLPQLIALKLYAGGTKSKADIIELLVRNPELDLEGLRELCRSYRLRGLDKLIAEARSNV
ncbi:MAG: hypothetical protein ACKOFH_05385 [Chthoniobacterales bacterium]